jgi:hypothetical protein
VRTRRIAPGSQPASMRFGPCDRPPGITMAVHLQNRGRGEEGIVDAASRQTCREAVWWRQSIWLRRWQRLAGGGAGLVKVAVVHLGGPEHLEGVGEEGSQHTSHRAWTSGGAAITPTPALIYTL